MMVCAGMLYFFPNVSLPQMSSRTRTHDGAGTSRGWEDTLNPPPVPPTVTPGFRRQTECEPCTCQDQQFMYTAVT
jgi:hypothetical protein